MIERQLAPILSDYLQAFSAVAVTGPRQSGKSTLIQAMLPDYEYVNFDDNDIRMLFHEDPKGFLNRYNNRVIFDEAQKVPEIFERIKIAVDEDRQAKGKFVLSGSSQFLMSHNITESLAGRIGLLELLPLCYQEMPTSLKGASVFQGGYPEPVTENYQHNTIWYKAYLETYLQKDVRQLLKIKDLRDFTRFISLLAARATKTLSLTELANEIGVAVNTIKSWLSVLEASYIVFLLPPYYQNFGKRIIKSPKIYFWDTGLVSHLTKITSQDLYDHGPMAGAIFENYVISEIAKKQKLTTTPSELFYFRSSGGEEIDLLVDHGQEVDLIEIKKSHSYTPKMMKTINAIAGDNHNKYLLYQGETLPGDNSHIWHYEDYLKQEWK